MQKKKPIFRRRKKSLSKFLESRQEETGPKAETRRRQNEQQDYRQNNKGADRTMESNSTALRFQNRGGGGETSEVPGLRSGPQEGTADRCYCMFSPRVSAQNNC